ncbi:MAG: carboxypeptidase-like regulatory domain-containing protein [Bacteroidales bacterium]|nr:carboxypeptidase-like regulatory domain-containing protein [Bacteroidales bacterium]
MIKHFFRIVLIFMVSLQTSHSQILKGRITNPNGEPIQYATVYIQELKQGTTANTKGDYELRLAAREIYGHLSESGI